MSEITMNKVATDQTPELSPKNTIAFIDKCFRSWAKEQKEQQGAKGDADA